ncbi:MAG: VanW family protein [Candidatus Magasanikbacteria bacterium]|nr:VanW family protein [Candidatus Magasanikbacteria bacterium]
MSEEQAHHRKRLITILVVVVVLWLLAMGRAVYAFQDKKVIYDGVKIGAQDFSGLTSAQAKEKILAFESRLSVQGLTFTYTTARDEERQAVIYPVVFRSDGTDSREIIAVDVETTVDALWAVGRTGTVVRKMAERVASQWYGRKVPAVVRVDRELFRDVVRLNLASDEQAARDARVVYEQGVFRVEPDETGVAYTVDRGLDDAVNLMRRLELRPIAVDRTVDKPAVTAAALSPLVPFLAPVAADDIMVTYEDPNKKEKLSWTLGHEKIAALLEVTPRDEQTGFALGLSSDALRAWIKEVIAPQVEVEARDAKFKIEGERVVEFQSSRAGVQIDIPALEGALSQVIAGRFDRLARGESGSFSTEQSVVSLAVQTAEPKIKTGDLNNLGIQEVLGIGTSSWRGSPANRIKNIRNGMNKLNGLLIKPGEEFSLLAALRPFTTEGGYLPELVIKGDKIEPEIGGGLCQIGTTSFRMAMNSGLPVTKRTNHGLVVTYYNDPTNGNPGTDATIYDPAPDFRFINDTGHYLLWTTHMDSGAGKLEFTLWGTSDGRKGSYSAPVVHNWIATGPMKEIETTDLEPGKRKCQSRHPGAVASFTYTVDLPSGEKKETLYKSYYRPLPEICSVGVEKKTEGETAPVEGAPVVGAPEDVPTEGTPTGSQDVDMPPVSVDDLAG